MLLDMYVLIKLLKLKYAFISSFKAKHYKISTIF